jgi:hypothetical protein
MMAAFERGLWLAVAGCFNKQTTYGQLHSFSGAAECAFATFVPRKGLLS